MVVVDKLSKTAHFILVKSSYKTVEIAEIFMREIFQVHGIPQVSGVFSVNYTVI